MITAEQAREKSGPTVQEWLDCVIEPHILTACENNKREVIIRQEPMCRWLYSNTIGSIEKDVINELRRLGYTVDLYYSESQFVDMGLKISWE